MRIEWTIGEIIESLGYDSKQFEKQMIDNVAYLLITGQMWDVKDDIILDILYNEFFEDISGALDIVDMLEERFGYNEFLHYAIVFRDRNLYE